MAYQCSASVTDAHEEMTEAWPTKYELKESSGIREWSADQPQTFVQSGEPTRRLLRGASECHLAGCLILHRASGGCGSEHPRGALCVVYFGHCENFEAKNSSTSSDTSFVRNAPASGQPFRHLFRRRATENQNMGRRFSLQALREWYRCLR